LKNNKRFMTYLMSIGVLLLVLTACSGDKTSGSVSTGSSNNKVFELDVNNPLPSTHHLAGNAFEPWKKLVEEKTEGRVIVNLYHGGTLGQTGTALEDVSGGISDVSYLTPSYYYDSRVFPWTIGSLPFSVPTQDPALTLSKVLSEFAPKYWRPEEIFQDLVYMGIQSTDPYVMISTKPIKKAEDLQNLKIRVPGKGWEKLIVSWGGTPVSVTNEEMYEALERGTIDVGIYTAVGSVGNKYYEVAPYIVKNVQLYLTPMVSIMNRDFYDSLPDDLKKIFDEELNPALAELITQSYVKESDQAWEDLAAGVEGKGEIIELPEKEVQKLRAGAKDQWDVWVKDANKFGYPGEKMLDEFKIMLEENGVELPF
jgi:TRAP-type transport system periplasmic protein